MVKDASKRQFERIIVWKLDRFARNRYVLQYQGRKTVLQSSLSSSPPHQSLL